MEKNGKPGSESSDQADPLSATAMFLRGFHSADITPAAPSEEHPEALNSGPAGAETMAVDRFGIPSAQESGSATGPGEFTRLFKASNPPVDPAAERKEPVVSTPVAAASPSQQAPGEFTRMFTGPAGPSARETAQPAPSQGIAPAAGKAKGFSAPGVSDSASGEGSFTQFFRGAASAERPPSAPVPAPQPARQFEDSGIPEAPKQTQQVPGTPEMSITGILASLSTPGGSPASSQPGSTGPYRASSPASSIPVPEKQAEPQMDAGSITQLIQKLALEQSAPPLAPPPAVPPPAPSDAGPGEFTRMISKLSVESALAEAPPPSAANAAPPIPAVAPSIPHVPKIPVPPPVPHLGPAAPVAPPQVPKPAPLPAPALPKGKLEGMVPVLLVINTFLLLVLIVIVLFQARGH